MSYRRSKNVRRGTVRRGPSRPVDPRYAPGGPPRRRVDTFGIGLMAISGAALLVLVFLLAFNRGQSTGQTVTTPSNPSNPSNPGVPSVTVDPTQQEFAFQTQTAPNILHRITLTEAKALYDAGNVKIIDVRLSNLYQQGHIRGAINVPHDQVATRLNDIPKTGNVVLYCQ